MSQTFRIHPENPQRRLVFRASEILRRGGVVVYPTDSTYALGCHLGDKGALDRIRRIRGLDTDHHFTLACRDLSELATYARVSDPAFRVLRAHTPGPYTFVLVATKLVPKRLLHPKQRTIGLRVPDHPIPQELLGSLAEPIMTTSLILPGDDGPLQDPEEIAERLAGRVDAIIDAGFCGRVPTTMVDLTDDAPLLMRGGCGPSDALGL